MNNMNSEKFFKTDVKFSEQSRLIDKPFFSSQVINKIEQKQGSIVTLRQSIFYRTMRIVLFLGLLLFPVLTEAI